MYDVVHYLISWWVFCYASAIKESAIEALNSPVVRLSVCWSYHSGRIWMKLAAHIYNVSGHCWQGFQSYKSKVKVITSSSVVMAEACILTMWHWGALVCSSLCVWNLVVVFCSVNKAVSWTRIVDQWHCVAVHYSWVNGKPQFTWPGGTQQHCTSWCSFSTRRSSSSTSTTVACRSASTAATTTASHF